MHKLIAIQILDGVHNALKATTQYAIQDNQLFLTGDNVRIILEIDNVQ